MLLKKVDLYFNHMGRPKSGYEKHLSLKNIVGELESLLNKKITFVNDCIGDNAKYVKGLKKEKLFF